METMPNIETLHKQFPGVLQYPQVNLADFLKTTDDNLIDLISKMLQYDPMKRLNAQDALKHPFFDNIPKQIRDICWPKGLPTPI